MPLLDIESLTNDKRSCGDFRALIGNYDSIFLNETWTNKNSIVDLNGYKLYHSYRKYQNKRAKRSSGGLLIYVRKIPKNSSIWILGDFNMPSINWTNESITDGCRYKNIYTALLETLLNFNSNSFNRRHISMLYLYCT